MLKLQVENKELFTRYHKMSIAFYELLELHEELRHKVGLLTSRYDWIEKAGLLDDAE